MAGVDLYTLKELLGPKDLRATQIYAHLSAEHLERAAGVGVAGGD
jgi:site-specific recombinase XerD